MNQESKFPPPTIHQTVYVSGCAVYNQANYGPVYLCSESHCFATSAAPTPAPSSSSSFSSSSSKSSKDYENMKNPTPANQQTPIHPDINKHTPSQTTPEQALSVSSELRRKVVNFNTDSGSIHLVPNSKNSRISKAITGLSTSVISSRSSSVSNDEEEEHDDDDDDFTEISSNTLQESSISHSEENLLLLYTKPNNTPISTHDRTTMNQFVKNVTPKALEALAMCHTVAIITNSSSKNTNNDSTQDPRASPFPIYDLDDHTDPEPDLALDWLNCNLFSIDAPKHSIPAVSCLTPEQRRRVISLIKARIVAPNILVNNSSTPSSAIFRGGHAFVTETIRFFASYLNQIPGLDTDYETISPFLSVIQEDKQSSIYEYYTVFLRDSLTADEDNLSQISPSYHHQCVRAWILAELRSRLELRARPTEVFLRVWRQMAHTNRVALSTGIFPRIALYWKSDPDPSRNKYRLSKTQQRADYRTAFELMENVLEVF
ncbi:uncharacterized protein SAPINGB_P001315 [Magnusiomyces paraingens]|uniref:Uncharacterized protein n=1 Tax=Magnusiomyces paraingens TaxID=2606893 RepID=A0A5E8B540_9ASCO|nr:uncharacterized protein SAPINGB_P001315 [Saprochaete ingens]VVT46642.1 unnamed protein product [Saprochaete ingens]